MSNVIRFLESMGSNPALMQLSPEAYAEAVAALDIDDAQRQALLVRDPAALGGLLGGREKMYCSQFPSREDQPAKREDQPDEEQKDDEEDKDLSASRKQH